MESLSIQLPDRSIKLDLKTWTIAIEIQRPTSESEATPTVTTGALEWSPTLLEGNAVDYEDAEKAAKALGPGWRLPTRQELESILDLSRHDPAIDTTRFPDTKSNYYWTSTPCAWNEDARWVVYFDHGRVYGGHRGDLACVRAVRAGQ